MTDQLPLGLLRTFEMAARHQSFARAAEALHVTPAAVSQQMRALEGRLGITLFTRKARGLTLTRAGQDYAAEVSAALASLAEATRKVVTPKTAGRIRISTFPSFALTWLLPRLPAFRSRFPDIVPELVIDARVSHLGPEGPDLAIRFGGGEYHGCEAQHLMDEYVFPACSPALLGGRSFPSKTANLLNLPLLIDDGLVAGERSMSWRDWLGDRYEKLPKANLIHLPDGLFTMQAMLLGQGAAIVRSSLATTHLKEGRLVRLTTEERKADFAYWIVTPKGTDDPRVKLFSAWLMEEAERR